MDHSVSCTTWYEFLESGMAQSTAQQCSFVIDVVSQRGNTYTRMKACNSLLYIGRDCPVHHRGFLLWEINYFDSVCRWGGYKVIWKTVIIVRCCRIGLGSLLRIQKGEMFLHVTQGGWSRQSVPWPGCVRYVLLWCGGPPTLSISPGSQSHWNLIFLCLSVKLGLSVQALTMSHCFNLTATNIAQQPLNRKICLGKILSLYQKKNSSIWLI